MQGYAIARGYYDQLSQGADMIAPCGLAWQVSRGVTGIPANCKAAIDEEYGPANPSPFVGNLTLPLKVAGLPTALSQLELYRILHDAPVRSVCVHGDVDGPGSDPCVLCP